MNVFAVSFQEFCFNFCFFNYTFRCLLLKVGFSAVGLTSSLLNVGTYSTGLYFQCHRAINVMKLCFFAFNEDNLPISNSVEDLLCVRRNSHDGCSLTVILNNIQDDSGFANYSRIFISQSSVLLFMQYQRYLCKLFLTFYVLQKVFFVVILEKKILKTGDLKSSQMTIFLYITGM